MNRDALERLRNKAKPTVQNRDLSAIPSVNNNRDKKSDSVEEKEKQDDKNISISNSSSLDIEIHIIQEASTTEPSHDKTFKKSYPDSMEIKTKQSTVRLEERISQKIARKCREEKISREVFLEALFVYFENHKSIHSKVLQEAKKRDAKRQKIANYRRAKSMISRFEN